MTRALSLLDIAAFRAQRALDSVVLAQVTWLIDGNPEVAPAKALAERLATSNQLGRVIVPAPILGGRDHWGRLPAVPEVVVETTPIDRAALMTWVDARARVPTLPFSQPWHLAMRPFTDGGYAVTLVVSHALTDGVGLVNVLASADQPASTAYDGHRPGLRTGIREAITGLPAGVRAALNATRMARSRDGNRGSDSSPALMANRTHPHTSVALVDSSSWHAAVATLEGSSNALFVSVAAQVATAVGRVTADATAIIGIPVNNRAAGDDVSANALTTVRLELPANRIRDVPYIRAELKRQLVARSREDASFVALLPIVPYLPTAALRPLAQAALGASEPVTSASHVGRLPRSLVDALGPAHAVFMNLGMQHPDAIDVPERVNALFTETPAGTVVGETAGTVAGGTLAGTVALHLGVVSDRIGDNTELRTAMVKALRSLGVEPREIL